MPNLLLTSNDVVCSAFEVVVGARRSYDLPHNFPA